MIEVMRKILLMNGLNIFSIFILFIIVKYYEKIIKNNNKEQKYDEIMENYIHLVITGLNRESRFST
jgi:hypothetical protein